MNVAYNRVVWVDQTGLGVKITGWIKLKWCNCTNTCKVYRSDSLLYYRGIVLFVPMSECTINVQKLRVVLKLFESLAQHQNCSTHYLCLCRRTWHIQSSEALPFDAAQFIIPTSSLKFIRLCISLYRRILNNIQLRSIKLINLLAFAGINSSLSIRM